MRNNSRIYLYIGVGALVLVLLCVGVMAMVGNNNGDDKNNTEIKDSPKENTYEDTHQSTTNDLINDTDSKDLAVVPEDMVSDIGEYEDSSEEWNAADEYQQDAVDAAANNYTFNQGSVLQWPVSGNIIMNYSMDKMVYFETLDAYKYNPAIYIQAEIGAPVVAGATGQVLSVTQEADTGLTVAMQIGSEYVIYYGQLKDCVLKEGDNVNRGEQFATVAAPSKYYTVEGSHLYVRLERAEEPVDPVEYLDISE